MKKHVIFLGVLCLSCWDIACGQMQPSDLQNKLKQSIQLGQKSQKKADAWAKERAELLNQLRDQKSQKQWADYQIQKYQIYIEKQKASLEELNRRRAEAQKIKMGLAPFLDDVARRLADFIKEDLPFLTEERSRRLNFLNESLNTYDMSLSEKTKQVFDALQIEAGYGGNVEHRQEIINVLGTPTQADVFRLGRVALFYRTPDGSHAGRFNRKTRQWESLPVNYSQEILQAMEIAEKKRTPVLLNLPIGTQ